MKRHLTHLILTAGLSAMLGSPAISAQEQMEVANIPFAFQANNTMLHAGKYSVSYDFRNGVLQMRDETGRGVFVTTYPTHDSAKSPRLAFSCYGDDCALSTIWMPDHLGHAAFKPHDNLARKIGLSASIRFVSLTTH